MINSVDRLEYSIKIAPCLSLDEKRRKEVLLLQITNLNCVSAVGPAPSPENRQQHDRGGKKAEEQQGVSGLSTDQFPSQLCGLVWVTKVSGNSESLWDNKTLKENDFSWIIRKCNYSLYHVLIILDFFSF